MVRTAPAIAALAWLFILVGAAPPATAGSVSGTVKVLKKDSKRTHGSFANAVVWLAGPSTPPPTAALTVNQRKKKFLPRVLPVVRGQVVHFTNQDDLDHNVFSTAAIESFDLGRYPKGDYRSVTFDEPGVVKVYCNIHKQMILDVLVLENRYFGVSDEDGVFSIEDVPPGEYELNVWHIYGGTHRAPITVGAEPMVIEDISLASTKVTRDLTDHLDKHGKKYPRKSSSRYKRR